MKTTLKLIILLLLIGCESNKKPHSFISIDYSSYWGFDHSIKIYNTGKAYIYYNFRLSTENIFYYYSLDLNKNQLDSLSNLVKTLYTIKIDSIYMVSRDSGRDFSLIINSDKGKLTTTYSGPYNGVEGLTPLYSFIDYIIHISDSAKESADKNFKFKSKANLKKILPDFLGTD